MTNWVQLEEDFSPSSCYAVYGGDEIEKNYNWVCTAMHNVFQRM